jgi:hypothetical protein
MQERMERTLNVGSKLYRSFEVRNEADYLADTEEQKERFVNDPEYYLQYRKLVEREINHRFKFIINGSKEQKEALDFSRAQMEMKLTGRKDLMEKLIPKNFAVGCRVGLSTSQFGLGLLLTRKQRPTPGNGYLECIADEENCQVIFSPITKITENGVVTEDTRTHEIDLLICATGFDMSFIPGYPIIGKNGVDIGELWAETPETYLSLAAPQFPNYFSKF